MDISPVDVAVVNIGCNDSAYSGTQLAVPLPEFKSSLLEIIKKLKECCSRIILVTPPPIRDEARTKRKLGIVLVMHTIKPKYLALLTVLITCMSVVLERSIIFISDLISSGIYVTLLESI